jgi:recombination protein RecT
MSSKGLIQQATQGVQGKKGAALRPIDHLKAILDADSVKKQFQEVLKENAGAFVTSIIDLYNTDTYLQMCQPKEVVMEALKAASLKLPINKQLGFAYIVPYKAQGRYVPTFQLGYKGYIQLAMRTGAYKYINADVVYEGELIKHDKLTGEIEIDPSCRVSDKKVGYFAFLETLNGFRKTLYLTTEQIIAHAQKYSKSHASKNSPWVTDFDAMALKTCLRLLLSKYGIMSVEMQQAYVHDVGPGVVEMADQKAAGVLDVEVETTEEHIEDAALEDEKIAAGSEDKGGK